jgi:hypothetical protein
VEDFILRSLTVNIRNCMLFFITHKINVRYEVGILVRISINNNYFLLLEELNL